MEARERSIGAGDLAAQLRRLRNIAHHNLQGAETPERGAYEWGQLNAFKAVALSYGLDLAEVDR